MFARLEVKLLEIVNDAIDAPNGSAQDYVNRILALPEIEEMYQDWFRTEYATDDE